MYSRPPSKEDPVGINYFNFDMKNSKNNYLAPKKIHAEQNKIVFDMELAAKLMPKYS